jgi:hypothetical protein
VIWARGFVFVVLAAIIVLGPFDRQVLGGRSEWFRAWRMFRGNSIGICDVRYVRHTEQGDEPIDRFEVLGYDVWAEAPREIRSIRENKLDDVTRRICRALPGADVRVTARCAEQAGWKKKRSPDRNACAR